MLLENTCFVEKKQNFCLVDKKIIRNKTNVPADLQSAGIEYQDL